VNLLLLRPDELQGDTARVEDRRAQHVREILDKTTGDRLRVGVEGGKVGEATIVAADDRGVTLSVRLDQEPPPKSAVTLVLALPRPPVLRRLLQQVTAMGVGRIVLLQTNRVEKSYWHSPALRAAAVVEQLRLGLEQARDTVLPEVWTRQRFRPFVEDELPSLTTSRRLLVADPHATQACPADVRDPVVLVVGPEGGFVDFELQALASVGARAVSLGERPLRVETATLALLGRIVPAKGRDA
jgi:RsmE family RNA methyltransferase